MMLGYVVLTEYAYEGMSHPGDELTLYLDREAADAEAVSRTNSSQGRYGEVLEVNLDPLIESIASWLDGRRAAGRGGPTAARWVRHDYPRGLDG